MKALSKKELQAYMQISSTTLGKLLNKTWFEELKKIGYSKNQKILSPKIINWIQNEWG